MSKNLIVQIFCPLILGQKDHLAWQNNEVLALSKKLAKSYAYKVDAEYKFITKPKIKFKHPTWERFDLFNDEYIKNYKNIMYLDTDVFCWPDAPNIFNFIKEGAFNVVQHCAYKTTPDGRPMFNAGVFILNEASAIIMRQTMTIPKWEARFKNDPNWEDSKELNDIVSILPSDKFHMLRDIRWNMKNKPDAFFTHLWGAQKKNNPDMPAIQKARMVGGLSRV